jgi:DNA-binding NarL/FixJ family response regulator
MLVDDEKMLRLGLRQMLPASEGFEVVADVRVGPTAEEQAARQTPDVVLLGIGAHNERAALNLVGRLSGGSFRRPPRVVVLADTRTADRCLLRMVLLGVSGFLLRSVTEAELSYFVKQVARGHNVLQPVLVSKLFTRTRELRPVCGLERRCDIPDVLESLSPRERDILNGIARGQSNKEIAKEVHLTVATVKSHVSNILTKLGARDRLQAALISRHF